MKRATPYGEKKMKRKVKDLSLKDFQTISIVYYNTYTTKGLHIYQMKFLYHNFKYLFNDPTKFL